MSDRKRLPNRRPHTTFKLQHEGHKYLVSIGFDGSIPLEMFINTEQRLGSMADIAISDAAVAVSLALQYGCPPEVLAVAMKRKPDGAPMGPLGAALDFIRKSSDGDDPI